MHNICIDSNDDVIVLICICNKVGIDNCTALCVDVGNVGNVDDIDNGCGGGRGGGRDVNDEKDVRSCSEMGYDDVGV